MSDTRDKFVVGLDKYEALRRELAETPWKLAADAQNAAIELGEAQGQLKRVRERADHNKAELERMARAVYPHNGERFAYSVDAVVAEIGKLRAMHDEHRENWGDALVELDKRADRITALAAILDDIRLLLCPVHRQLDEIGKLIFRSAPDAAPIYPAPPDAAITALLEPK